MSTNTYVALDKVTVGTATNQITFTSIPSTYTDLKIVVNGSFATEDYIVMQLNGDTSTNYSETTLRGNGSSAASGYATSRAFTALESLGAGANERFMNQINIMNYANTTTYKTILTRSDNASRVTSATVSLWRKTPEAVTSVKLYGLLGYNFNVGSTFSLYGIKSWEAESTPKATGGYVFSDSTYWYHSFPFSGTFTPNQSLTADVLCIAGGGGAKSGGGGAGGYRLLTSQSMTATAYTVTTGAGGASGTTGNTGTSTKGGNSSISGSSFTTITSTGGGNGSGPGDGGNAGGSGGAPGGESSSPAPAAGTGNQGGYTPVEGYASGAGTAGQAAPYPAAGGGGASAVGTSAAGSTAGSGGAGSNSASTWATATLTGVSGYYAGGGGGSSYTVQFTSNGGSGGGGAGNGSDGAVSTGSGGGGNTNSLKPGNGGSGLVIVRYAK